MLAFKPLFSRSSRVLCHRTWLRRGFSANALQGFTSALAQYQPTFSISPANVEVLSAPNQFYTTLLDMIRRAKRQIFISSLYIGAEDVELIETLRAALASNASLRLHVHLDLNRSTRPGPSSPAAAISPLVKEFPDRVEISLFRSPKLKGLMAKLVPPRFNEGWGTWHPKIYGVDDDVMISGANLNKSYFTNRQDRYLRFTAHPELAKYCHGFLQTSATFSHRLLPSASPDSYDLRWADSTVHPHHIESKAENALRTFQKSWVQKHSETPKSGEVLLFPVIQAGQFNIREEEKSLSLLFEHLQCHLHTSSSAPSIDLTSGYFGLYEPYQDLVLRSNVNCQIICAGPKANGFFNSHGISGRIPEAYTLLEQRFMTAVRASGQSNVTLSEWEKDAWTYHAKGIWVRPSDVAPPVLTLFGSTNLNSRSSHLDTELSFIMSTPENDNNDVLSLRQQLQREVEALKAHAVPWQGQNRPVRLGTKMLVGLGVGGML